MQIYLAIIYARLSDAFLVLGCLLLTSSLCFADPVTIQIPDSAWSVSFDSPTALHLTDSPVSNAIYFVGNNDRFNVSLFVGAPQCGGGESLYDNYECLRSKVIRIPGVIERSISRERRANSIQLTYLVYIPTGDTAIKTMHTHVLFEHGGQWGDLHVSIVKPMVSETARLLGIGDEFKISE